jgi:hypothetical protein
VIISFSNFFTEHKYKLKNLEPPPPNKSWKNRVEVRNFLDFLAENLHVRSPEDWYRTSHDQIYQLGGTCTFFWVGEKEGDRERYEAWT